MYVVDTNVLSNISCGNPNTNVTNWFDSVDDVDIFFSVAVIMEQRKGIEQARKKVNADIDAVIAGEERLNNFIADFSDHVIQVDIEIADEWGKLVGQKQQDFIDLLVAATANARDMTVVTRNTKHFKNRVSKLIDPFKWGEKKRKPVATTSVLSDN